MKNEYNIHLRKQCCCRAKDKDFKQRSSINDNYVRNIFRDSLTFISIWQSRETQTGVEELGI